jgi:hypothetical protein
MFLTNYALGLAGSVWFKDRDAPEPSPGDIEHHFGLLRDDLDPKPACEAVATLARLLGGASPPVALRLDDGEHGLVFEKGEGRITVLWAESTVLWRLVAASEEARIVGRNGGDVTPMGLSHGLQLRLRSDAGPIYLVGDVEILPRSLCAGDCRGDGSVNVEELVTAVAVAIGATDPIQCAAVDTNDDGHAGANEIVAAVGNALQGCPPDASQRR